MMFEASNVALNAVSEGRVSWFEKIGSSPMMHKREIIILSLRGLSDMQTSVCVCTLIWDLVE